MDPDAQAREWERSKEGRTCIDCAECEAPGRFAVDDRFGEAAEGIVWHLCSTKDDVSRTIGSIAGEVGSMCREAQRTLCWCRAHKEFVRAYDPVEECQEWREP